MASTIRKPAPRFTEDDKAILIGLVNQYRRVLECKKTDVAWITKKNDTWNELAKRFNANHGVTPRDAKQLKKCWGNLKQKWKEEKSEEKRKILKTGGGPPPAPMSAVSALVGSVAGHMAMRIRNTDDSDGALYLPPIESEPVVRLLQPVVTGEQDSLCDSFEDYQPSSPMYESVHEAHSGESCQGIPPAPDHLQVSRPSTSCQGITPTPEENASVPEENAEAPTERAGQIRGRMALLQQALGEEADVRMALLREEHAMRLKLMQDDHIDLLKKREEEHKLKMEILQVQKKTHQMRQDNLQLHQWAE